MSIKGGFITALITPFSEEGVIDFESLERLVIQQVSLGVEGFVISGTTGESPNLLNEEVCEIFKFVKKVISANTTKLFPLIIGVGTNSTHQTIEKIKNFEHLNADGYLVVTPYYNKPTQKGLLQHFKTVAAATKRDVLLYDVPGRTITELSVETILELSKVKNITGLKDATGNLEKIEAVRSLVCPSFLLFSGDDETAGDFIRKGGNGVISVLSHVIPQEFKISLGEVDKSSKYQKLCSLLFIEPNPTVVKAALFRMGLISSDFLRLPLLKIEDKNRLALDAELAKLEIVS